MTFLQANVRSRLSSLIPQLTEFCSSYPSIISGYPDLSQAGTLPGNSEEKTFYDDNYRDLVAISFLSKLLMPLWGSLDQVFKKMDLSIEEADLHFVSLIDVLLKESHFDQTYVKLKRLVNDLGQRQMALYDRDRTLDRNSDHVLANNNLSLDDFNKINLATVLCKRLVTFDPIVANSEEEEVNLVRYIHKGLNNKIHKLLKDLGR